MSSAALGQTLIPIPVVGALLGSIAASTVLSLGKDMLNRHERARMDDYQRRVDAFIATLDAQYRETLDALMAEYRRLGELQDYAFDLNLNIRLRFESSVELARFAGVAETEILHSESEIDDFFG